MQKGFREYYHYDYIDFYDELSQYYPERHLDYYIKKALRNSASLFGRDCRKLLINENSFCNFCGAAANLTIDHIIPVCKGGKNELSNVQILCATCNYKKGNKIITNGNIQKSTHLVLE